MHRTGNCTQIRSSQHRNCLCRTGEKHFEYVPNKNKSQSKKRLSAVVVDNYIVILMNENICRPKCITSERIGSVEHKSADKCINEYNYNINLMCYNIQLLESV